MNLRGIIRVRDPRAPLVTIKQRTIVAYEYRGRTEQTLPMCDEDVRLFIYGRDGIQRVWPLYLVRCRPRRRR